MGRRGRHGERWKGMERRAAAGMVQRGGRTRQQSRQSHIHVGWIKVGRDTSGGIPATNQTTQTTRLPVPER